jgi:pimeloyl-ACP methyl ester carboxylesterase
LQLNDDVGSNTVYPIPGYGDVETMNFESFHPVMRQAAAASPLRPMPLAVLSHVQPFPLTEEQLGFPPATYERASLAAYRELAALLPNGRLIVASKSGHDIHQDQPAVVTEAIREVVEGVRDPDTWDELRACCARS